MLAGGVGVLASIYDIWTQCIVHNSGDHVSRPMPPLCFWKRERYISRFCHCDCVFVSSDDISIIIGQKERESSDNWFMHGLWGETSKINHNLLRILIRDVCHLRHSCANELEKSNFSKLHFSSKTFFSGLVGSKHNSQAVVDNKYRVLYLNTTLRY